MDDTFTSNTHRPRGKGAAKAIAGVGLAAFMLGAAGMWYLAGRDELHAGNWFGLWPDAEVARPVETPAALASPVTSVTVQQGAMEQRLAAMEQRLARLDLQAQAAAGNAGRAEGLLVVFAARRAIDRGAPLGYLEDQLRLRFGDAQPNAVRRIASAAKNPVTVEQLVARLDTMREKLVEAPGDEGLLDRVTRELGQLFVIRREDTPSPAAQNRLDRANLFLQSGRVDAAVAEVRLLPNAAAASTWLSDAQRFADTQRALDQLESFALLEPRTLRGGDGERIEQLSPAVEAVPAE